VFAMDSNGLSANSEGVYFTSNFPVDFTINKERTHSSDPWIVMSRLQGDGNYLDSSGSGAETSGISNGKFDRMTGWMDSGSAMMSWMWKRAPKYFDVCCYNGTGSARTVSHNLGVVPEMMWVKRRDTTGSWMVYHKGLNGGTNPEQYVIYLHVTEAENQGGSGVWNNTAPTSSVFTVNTNNGVNNSSGKYIALLFASVAGICKVGSYTGNNTDGHQIDCGFSSGARFVLIKNTTVSSTNWLVFDTVRGIVAGNDARLYLNATDSENSGTDYIDPYSSGFELTANAQVNYSGSTYIFYAIA